MDFLNLFVGNKYEAAQVHLRVPQGFRAVIQLRDDGGIHYSEGCR